MKLVRREAESQALVAALGGWPGQATSVVGRIELLRAAARDGASALTRARAVAANLALIELDDAIQAAAEGLRPPELRTLDAIHIASAQTLGHQLGALIAYDQRLLATAAGVGVPTLSPGAGTG